MLEINKIHCCNCLDLMAKMPDGFIDLTVTSPPYDNLRSYNGYEFDFEAIAKDLYRVTKMGGVVVWVVGDKTIGGDETGTSFQQALYFKSIGFKLWDTMGYEKVNPFPGDCGKRYQQTFEFMFAFVKGKEPQSFNPIQVPSKNPGKVMSRARLEASGRRKLEKGWHGYADRGTVLVPDARISGNIFSYVVGISNGVSHPAVFPEQLAKDQITSWSNENDLIYDPFMGSGTTAKAAHQLKRNWIGSEISQEYVDLANKRLEPYLAQESLF